MDKASVAPTQSLTVDTNQSHTQAKTDTKGESESGQTAG